MLYPLTGVWPIGGHHHRRWGWLLGNSPHDMHGLTVAVSSWGLSGGIHAMAAHRPTVVVAGDLL